MGFGSSSSSNNLSVEEIVKHYSDKGPVEIRAYFAQGDKDKPLFDAVLDGKINGNTLALIYSKSNLPIPYRQFNPLLGYDKTYDYIKRLLNKVEYKLLCEFFAKIDNPHLVTVFMNYPDLYALFPDSEEWAAAGWAVAAERDYSGKPS